MEKLTGFKNVPINGMTPEVLFAQAQELKWRGAVVVGILKECPEHGVEDSCMPLAINETGLTNPEFAMALAHVQERMNARIRAV